jgi:hypothetical protein
MHIFRSICNSSPVMVSLTVVPVKIVCPSDGNGTFVEKDSIFGTAFFLQHLSGLVHPRVIWSVSQSEIVQRPQNVTYSAVFVPPEKLMFQQELSRFKLHVALLYRANRIDPAVWTFMVFDHRGYLLPGSPVVRRCAEVLDIARRHPRRGAILISGILQVSQNAVMDIINPSVDGQLCPVLPRALNGGRVANVGYLFDYIKFTEQIEFFVELQFV